MGDRIKSAANPRVKRLTALCRKGKERRKEQAFVIEGERLFADTPAEYLKEVYVTDRFLREHGMEESAVIAPEATTIYGTSYTNTKTTDSSYARTVHKLHTREYTVVTEEIMAKISDTETPQGIVCVAGMPSYSPENLLGRREKDGCPLLLLLENIQDPGNLGTMFRTAEAAGATGILMSRNTVDLFNPKTVRSTMSAIFRVPFLYTDTFVQDVQRLEREEGLTIYAAHLGAKKAYDEVPYTGSTGILIGNEGNGLSEEAAKAANGRILIPMLGQIESLNAAMAAGILLFEAARQRRRGE